MSIRSTFFSSSKTKGFTLVEILVYIAILTIVSAGALTALFSLSDRITENRANQLVALSARTSLERMLSDIRAANAVDTFYSAFESTPGELTLIQGATTTAYSVVGGALVVEVNSTVVGPLNDSRVVVDELRFFHYDNAVTELVRIKLTLSATVGSSTVTKTFNTSATLKGSYE